MLNKRTKYSEPSTHGGGGDTAMDTIVKEIDQTHYNNGNTEVAQCYMQLSVSEAMQREFVHAIKEPFEYLSGTKGKDVRTKFIESFTHWISISDQMFEKVKSITQKLHNASLMYAST